MSAAITLKVNAHGKTTARACTATPAEIDADSSANAATESDASAAGMPIGVKPKYRAEPIVGFDIAAETAVWATKETAASANAGRCDAGAATTFSISALFAAGAKNSAARIGSAD